MKDHAKKALTNADINTLITSEAYMSDPDLKKAVIKVCKKRQYDAGMHRLINLGHMDEKEGRMMMACWAFEKGDLQKCLRKMGRKCSNVKQTPTTVAMYLVCKSGTTEPQKDLRTLLLKGRDHIRQRAIEEKIIQPSRMEKSVRQWLNKPRRHPLSRAGTLVGRHSVVQG